MTKAQTITTDRRNANKGTPRGEGMLERSLQQYGAGRSVLIDKHGALIAGNKTFAKAQELGIPVQVIETDGRTLIAVKRTDLDLETDKAAQELGIVDNRSSEVSLDWDADVLRGLADDGVDLSQFWFDDELDRLLTQFSGDVVDDPLAEWGGMPGFNQDDLTALKQITVSFFRESDVEAFGRLIGQPVTMATRGVAFPDPARTKPRGIVYQDGAHDGAA